MLVVTGTLAANSIADPDVRRLVMRRYAEICGGETYDCNRHGEMIVVEPGDSVAVLEKESGCPILRNFFDDSCFGDPDFAPSFEVLEEHSACYEMGFVLNDDGFGVLFFVPKHPGIDCELLSLCRTYAVKPPKRRRF